MVSDFPSDKESKALELEVRRKLYKIVKKFSGSHFRDIQRKSNLSTGSAQYHLNYLSKQGLIKKEKHQNKIRYYTKNLGSSDKKIIGILRQRSLRKIILCIILNPKYNHEKIVETVNLSPSTVSWHLNKLKKEDIVIQLKKGRKTFYRLLVSNKDIMNLLIIYQESFLDKMVDNIIEMWEI